MQRRNRALFTRHAFDLHVSGCRTVGSFYFQPVARHPTVFDLSAVLVPESDLRNPDALPLPYTSGEMLSAIALCVEASLFAVSAVVVFVSPSTGAAKVVGKDKFAAFSEER